jgi:integrase
MKGTTYKRGGKPGNEKWHAQFTVGSYAKKNRKTVHKGGFARKMDAEAWLADQIARYGKGDKRVLNAPSQQKLGEYLDSWLEARKPTLKPTTWVGYQSIVEKWIKPHIGGVALADIDWKVLTKLYGLLAERGGKPTPTERRKASIAGRDPVGTPLGPRSVQGVSTLLSMAFRHAVEIGDMQVNPAKLIPKDLRRTHKPSRQAERFWEADQAQRFLDSTAADRLHPLWAFLLGSGARRGEALALRWRDFDLDTGMVKIERNRVIANRQIVEGTPKTKKARRRVLLGASTVAVLRAWKKQQLEERMQVGPDVYNTDGYVFTDELGQPIRPDAPTHPFRKACAKAGVPNCGLHGLRHTSATLLLEGKRDASGRVVVPGAPPHVVQERLGHEDVATTLGLYGHVLKGQETDAARLLDEAIWGSS